MTITELPNDISAEEAVLGAILLGDTQSLLSAIEILEARHFYNIYHRDIYTAILRLWREGQVVDEITVRHELALDDKLEAMGGSARLNRLVAEVATTVYVRYYAGIVRRASDMRDAIEALTQGVQTLYEAREDPDGIRAQVAEKLLRDVSTKAWAKLADVMTLDQAEPGLPLPWPDLQNILQGLRPGKLYIVAGRPSQGKSTFALAIELFLAHRGYAIANATLEDTPTGIVDRLLRMEMGIDDRELLERKRHPDNDVGLMDAFGSVGNLDIWTNDHIDASNVIASLSAVHSQRKLNMIIVDYIQLFAANTAKHSRYDQVSDISIQFARLAQRLSIPIILVSQLNRAADDRPDHRPIFSDLRETGQLEQDAHAVLFLWRPGHYYQEGSKEWKEEYRYLLNVSVAKNKDGPTGSVKLYYDLPSGNIRSWSNR